MAATDHDELVTEAGGASADIDLLSSHELVELMNDEDDTVAPAVRAASVQIAEVIDAVVERLERGGRLIYVGAGTSGALAQLDAAECETTFSAPPSHVMAVVAGSGASSSAERDAAEDDECGGAQAIESVGVGPQDAVVAVSASGRTPYAVGALHAAAKAGALTAAVVSAPGSELAQIADHEVSVVVGPEVLAGSTRLKAGTAQKLVLNTISTVTMIRLGKTYKNLMVDVRGTNAKLRARIESIVLLATGAEPDEVHDALEAAGGDAKVAIVALIADVDADVARTRLKAAGGRVRRAVER